MKVEFQEIHRLSISKSCGCKASREFNDEAYKEPLSETTFVPCAKHKEHQAVDILEEMMIEVLNEKAESYEAPEPEEEKKPVVIVPSSRTEEGPVAPRIRANAGADPVAARRAQIAAQNAKIAAAAGGNVPPLDPKQQAMQATRKKPAAIPRAQVPVRPLSAPVLQEPPNNILESFLGDVTEGE
jgi:hypothetical protein